jgi:hypothetical protein
MKQAFLASFPCRPFDRSRHRREAERATGDPLRREHHDPVANPGACIVTRESEPAKKFLVQPKKNRIACKQFTAGDQPARRLPICDFFWQLILQKKSCSALVNLMFTDHDAVFILPLLDITRVRCDDRNGRPPAACHPAGTASNT